MVCFSFFSSRPTEADRPFCQCQRNDGVPGECLKIAFSLSWTVRTFGTVQAAMPFTAMPYSCSSCPWVMPGMLTMCHLSLDDSLQCRTRARHVLEWCQGCWRCSISLQMIRKSVETRDWLSTLEPRNVRPVMKRVVEDITTLDLHVGQLFEEGHRKEPSSGEWSIDYHVLVEEWVSQLCKKIVYLCLSIRVRVTFIWTLQSWVHKNKSMQHHTLGSGTAEFQVTWLPKAHFR